MINENCILVIGITSNDLYKRSGENLSAYDTYYMDSRAFYVIGYYSLADECVITLRMSQLRCKSITLYVKTLRKSHITDSLFKNIFNFQHIYTKFGPLCQK